MKKEDKKLTKLSLFFVVDRMAVYPYITLLNLVVQLMLVVRF